MASSQQGAGLGRKLRLLPSVVWVYKGDPLAANVRVVRGGADVHVWLPNRAIAGLATEAEH
jgi:hypothetical protein